MSLTSIIQKYRDNGYLQFFTFAVIILFVLIFLFRGTIARIAFEYKCKSIHNRYGLAINVDKIGFSGIRTIYLEKLTAIPDTKDTLFSIQRAEVKLSLTELVRFKINPLEIWLTHPKLNLTGERDSSNYSFIYSSQRDSLQPTESDFKTQHLNTFYRMLKAMFGLTTATYHVTDFFFGYHDRSYSTSILVPEFESNSKGLITQIDINENGNHYSIKLTGKTDKSSNSIQFKAFRMGDKIPLPLLYHKFGVNISFDTVDFKITANKLMSSEINLELNSSVKSLEVFSNKLSDQTVKINKGALDFQILLDNENYLIDSTSSINLNGLKASIYIEYLPNQKKYLSFKISTGEFQSQQLFESLPDGLFNNLKGVKSSGTIDFSFAFGSSLVEPERVIITPKLITKNFSITQYGLRNFSALNDTFSYDVYNEGQYLKTIHLGSTNKEYRSLDEISPLITNAIITSEDGGFYSNQGFDLDALKYAISENIKQKRYARGGSTITMQLIKNLYLNQNKNLFRKAEEYLIVWLIESQAIVSKDRLLEIYLNIIEWGPDIYGVSEACRFYFDKDPKDITLDEALYLSSVIPRPKKFKYLFEKDGNLKSFMESDFNFIASKMLQRGMIDQEQFDNLSLKVRLTGRAKELLVDTTNMGMDSLSIDEIRLNEDTTLLLP